MVYTVEFSTEVKATPEQVRSIILDFPKWAEWNSFITKIESLGATQSPQPGEKVKVLAVGAGEFEGVVFKNDETELSWVGILITDSILKGKHYFKYEKIDEHTTKFIHGEHFEGFLFPAFKWFKGEDSIKADYKVLVDGLARRVQELYN